MAAGRACELELVALLIKSMTHQSVGRDASPEPTTPRLAPLLRAPRPPREDYVAQLLQLAAAPVVDEGRLAWVVAMANTSTRPFIQYVCQRRLRTALVAVRHGAYTKGLLLGLSEACLRLEAQLALGARTPSVSETQAALQEFAAGLARGSIKPRHQTEVGVAEEGRQAMSILGQGEPSDIAFELALAFMTYARLSRDELPSNKSTDDGRAARWKRREHAHRLDTEILPRRLFGRAMQRTLPARALQAVYRQGH